MMNAVRDLSRKIGKVERKDDRLYLFSEACTIRLTVKERGIVRVTVLPVQKEEHWDSLDKPGVVNGEIFSDWIFEETQEKVLIGTGEMTVEADRTSGLLSFYRGNGTNELLFRERKATTFEKYTTYLLTGKNQVTEKIQTPDGEKTILREAEKVANGEAFHITWFPQFADEALYGLGQHEEGFGSLRGHTVYLHQANRKISVPMLVSTKGYGVLADTYSPMIFNDFEGTTYLYNESAKDWDYYVICAENMDGAVAGYRRLTGKAALLPKWAFGYVQSKERYESAEDLTSCVEESRRRGLGMDCIVLDWMSWEDGKWGQKTFDRKRFPDPKQMMDAIHENHTHFMLSIWPTVDPSCENYREFSEKDLLLPASNIYNPFKENGRKTYWNQIKEDILPAGTDAFWCDSSEPLTPEWGWRTRPEASRLFHEYCAQMGPRVSEEMSQAFALYHAMGIYEGQTADVPEKRVCNLTRSAYTGQQRYGTVMWSGDIAASWDTFRQQLGSGLNFCAAGIPFWTTDVGAFFVKPGNFWYWDGEYEDPLNDDGYKELYTRWYQWSGFMPMFRCHGTDCDRELWAFGDEGNEYYDALVKANRLRYELMPYIYSEAGKVWLEDGSMIRNLAFAFPEDRRVWDITNQYMFGASLMICPVTEPMSCGVRRVYLPAGCNWYDFYTGEKYVGGNDIEIKVTLDRIPVFAKEGSIIPMADAACSTGEQGEGSNGSGVTHCKVFGEGDCEYILYTDAGDGYDYETGGYTLWKIGKDGIPHKLPKE